jgi:hypothetical protein
MFASVPKTPPAPIISFVERAVQMNVNRNIALQPILQLQEERIPAVTQVDRHLRVKGVAIRQNDPGAAIYAFTFA